MLKQQLRKRHEEGFTIIEVLIVLAIAGLILLIVFLAVPALERNARNTSRKEDVGNILSGFAQYKADNSGNSPTSATVSASGQLTLCVGAACENVNNIGHYTATADYNFYTGATVPGTPPGVDAIDIVNGDVCTGSTPSAGSSGSVAIWYSIETGGGGTLAQCQAS